MTALIIGTRLKITDGKQVDSLIPILRTASKTLVPGVDQIIQADPTAGAIVFTLPDAVTNPGVAFSMKRIVNGGNTISLNSAGLDTIDGTSNGYKMSLVNEFLSVYSDGTTDWKVFAKDLFAICTMEASATTFGVTTSLLKFTSWDTVIFDTPEKLVGDLINNVVNILEFQGPSGADGYQVIVELNFEHNNNATVSAQLFANGALIGNSPVATNALGSGKPANIVIIKQIGITALTDLELRVSSETAGTMTIISASVQIQRIGR